MNRAAGQAPSSDAPSTETGKDDAQQVVEAENQETLHEIPTSLNETSIKDGQIEQDKSKLLAAAGNAHMTEKALRGSNAPDPGDLQSQFDSVMRVNDISNSQNASSAGQFAGNGFSLSSDARSEQDPPKSNLLPSEDNSLRPQFLDQTTGVSPSAPPSGDGRAGRSEMGQPTPIHASESERISELRGTFSSAQSVTLDLDPLDMGPLRVRIMMTDQTVHAHIRTEHGELGQGLLQQGQSLEASLRTTGLEMGMLRVTVDQQQQGRGDNAWAFQQQPSRPGTASGPPRRRENRKPCRDRICGSQQRTSELFRLIGGPIDLRNVITQTPAVDPTTTQTVNGQKILGQQDFLKMLLTQLQNQRPLNTS